MTLRLRSTAAGLATVIAIAYACTSSGGDTEGAEGPFRPSFEEATCPDDVAAVILTFVSCGYLTVLEDRADPDGPTIRLFVTKIEPADGPVDPDPMFTIGYDLASIPSYASIGPLAQRMGRVTYLMDQRGAGHSRPLLECPEVTEVAEQVTGARLSDPAARAELLGAVERCRDRLTDSGIDLSAYTLEQSAADVEDLRRALGIPSWNVMSWGSDSRVVFELMRRSPDGLRSVTFHGPQVPQLDAITEAPGDTREAIAEVAAVCAEDRRCNRAYPDLVAAFALAIERLDREPVEVDVEGASRLVVVDGAAFVRAIRNLISDSDLAMVPRIPATIDAALGGDVGEVAAFLADDRHACAGYLGDCTLGYAFSHGAYYSALCHDMAPFVDRAALGRAIDDDPAWTNAFGEHPYLEICEVWDVAAGDALVHEPVSSDVPVLIFRGQFDAYSSRTAVDAAAERLSGAEVVHVAYQNHDIKGLIECYRGVRRDWLDRPTEPLDTSCLDGMAPPVFTNVEPSA